MRSKLIYPFLITFCLFAPDLAAQWQAYTPALPDTAGTFDLRIADGNDQVAWGISMKYDKTSTGNAQFDMSGLAAGVYTVMVSSKEGYLTRRVVKG